MTHNNSSNWQQHLDHGKLIALLTENGLSVRVYQHQNYRWLTFDSEAIQSVCYLPSPERIVLPVTQAMMLPLLWLERPQQILSLGIGGAAIERFCQQTFSAKITSIEQSTAVMSVAKQYFALSGQGELIHDDASEWVAHCAQQTSKTFDVIFCDAFNSECHDAQMEQSRFYDNLTKILHSKGTAVVNLYVETDNQLSEILTLVRKYFRYQAIISFSDYKNILLLLSQQPFPSENALLAATGEFNKRHHIDFTEYLQKFCRLPQSIAN